MSEYSTIPPVAPANWLWRGWQAVIVPLFYPLFGIACALLLLLVPLAHLAIRDQARRTRWFRYALHHVAGCWLGLARALGVFDYHVSQHNQPPGEALQPLLASPVVAADKTQGFLLIANHPSLIDALMVLSLVPNLCCVMKSDLRGHPILGLLIRNLNYLSNDNPQGWLQQAQARLEQGESILVFPEGTRTLAEQPVDFKLGAAELALRAQASILPLILHYNSRYLSKACPWYELPPKKITYQLEFGPCLDVGVLAAKPQVAMSARNRARQNRRWLNQQLQTYFRDRLRHPPLWPRLPLADGKGPTRQVAPQFSHIGS